MLFQVNNLFKTYLLSVDLNNKFNILTSAQYNSKISTKRGGGLKKNNINTKFNTNKHKPFIVTKRGQAMMRLAVKMAKERYLKRANVIPTTKRVINN